MRLLLLLLIAPYYGLSEPKGCEDADPKCTEWATQGECSTNAVWMMANCRKSCHSCQGGEKAWKLRQHIQETYKNDTENTTREVRVESVRINNLEIDEKKQSVRVYGRMVLSWNDTKVSWQKQEWGLSWLNFYWIQIWTPQIVQINGGVSSPNTGSVTSKVLAANYTGKVYLWADFTFSSPYSFVYEEFPNDLQRICYKFDDKRLLAARFSVAEEVRNKEREEFTDTRVSGWQIEGLEMNESPYTITTLSDWHKNPFDIQTANCEMCVTLRRNAVYFVSEMLLPALLTTLFTLSAVFFQLSSRQAMLLAFSIVSQLLSLLLVSQRLPSFTTHTPTILKYAGFNLIMTGLLFVASLILERLASSPTDIPPPHSVDRLVSLVSLVLPLPKTTKHEDVSLKYAAPAHALNQVLFCISFIIYVFVIIASFVF
ncbi:unnamed protein product, partial [Mesorhabditis belari]|uniref:ShKT domain-containing protein n=1 Tax=Mesorhabditis belari TaxID=2138241 RepID=A0AAF3FJ55_9BILA